MAGQRSVDFESDCINWLNELIQGKSLCAQMSQEELQEVYALSYLLYRDRQYHQASLFFRLLVVAQPSEAKYWKGLGACLQMKKSYEEALNCYICSQMLHRHLPDPYLYVYAADCYFALQQVEEGLKALEAARLSAEKTKHLRILQHVALMRERWSKSHS